jgi:hypothetical protein
MRRRTASLLLSIFVAGTSAALRADAGELVHFRLPDGGVGFVDDPSKVPPGAVIETREFVAPPPVDPASEAPRPVVPRKTHGDIGSDGAESARSLSDRCRRFDLPPGCSEADVGRAETWAARAERLRSDVRRAEENVESRQRQYDQCDRSTARTCSTRLVEQAQEELAARQRALDVSSRDVRHLGFL